MSIGDNGFCLFLFVFNQLLFADKTIENDSLYTSEYISRIYMAEPERALSLLDGAESKKTIPLRIIHELRSRVYRNMYMTKLAFLYAKNRILSGGRVRGTKRSPTGIRRGGFAHSRKTGSFKVFTPPELISLTSVSTRKRLEAEG